MPICDPLICDWGICDTEPVASSNSLLRRVLRDMEKHSVGDYPWLVGLWEPGMWENNTPLRKILKNLEK